MGELSHSEALKFYIVAGVDETYGDSPSSFPGAVSPPFPGSTGESRANKSQSGAEAEAERIASECTSVAELQAAIRAFDLCPLSKYATHPHVGAGVERPKLLVITEMPEATEDALGRALSGPHGELLAKIMPNLKRSFDEDAFVFPAIFWRPAGGVAPDKAVVSMLRPFVKKFVELLAPEMILTLGSVPLGMLFGRDEAMAGAHGRWLKFEGIPVMPTFSLASISINSELKKAAWKDMQLLLNPPEKSNVA